MDKEEFEKTIEIEPVEEPEESVKDKILNDGIGKGIEVSFDIHEWIIRNRPKIIYLILGLMIGIVFGYCYVYFPAMDVIAYKESIIENCMLWGS